MASPMAGHLGARRIDGEEPHRQPPLPRSEQAVRRGGAQHGEAVAERQPANPARQPVPGRVGPGARPERHHRQPGCGQSARPCWTSSRRAPGDPGTRIRGWGNIVLTPPSRRPPAIRPCRYAGTGLNSNRSTKRPTLEIVWTARRTAELQPKAPLRSSGTVQTEAGDPSPKDPTIDVSGAVVVLDEIT